MPKATNFDQVSIDYDFSIQDFVQGCPLQILIY